MSVIIFNPNCREDPESKEKINEFNNMSNHCLYVWKNVVPYSKAKEIYIVAHSAGGYCLVDLVTNFQSKFIKNVIKMALTDSAHGNYIKKNKRKL